MGHVGAQVLCRTICGVWMKYSWTSSGNPSWNLTAVECDAELREFLTRRRLLDEDASQQAVRDALTRFLCGCVYEDLDVA